MAIGLPALTHAARPSPRQRFPQRRPWSEHDFDVFDGDRNVGRIYGVGGRPDGQWIWGVSFQLTGKKRYGRSPSLDYAKAALKAEYLAWKSG